MGLGVNYFVASIEVGLMVNFKQIIWYVVLGVIALILFSIGTTGGATSVAIVQQVFNFLLWGGILIGGALAFKYFFIDKHPISLNKVVKEKHLESAKMSMPREQVRDLYLRGDKEHQGKKLGKIDGYYRQIRIVNLEKEGIQQEKEGKDGKKTIVTMEALEAMKKKGIKRLQINLTHFAVKTDGGLFGMFKSPEIFTALEKVSRIDTDNNGVESMEELEEFRQHSKLVGDVWLTGVSLIKTGEAYYLDTFEASPLIDLIHTGYTHRELLYMTLDNQANLLDKAMDSNIVHELRQREQKLIDANKLLGRRDQGD